MLHIWLICELLDLYNNQIIVLIIFFLFVINIFNKNISIPNFKPMEIK